MAKLRLYPLQKSKSCQGVKQIQNNKKESERASDMRRLILLDKLLKQDNQE
jgi:hypothetical protein